MGAGGVVAEVGRDEARPFVSGAASRPSDRRRRTFRPDIQGLRAVAVVLVLAYHVWPSVLSGGYVGVDVFFVISGFLITGHLLEEGDASLRSLLRFWSRRIRRLLPAALLVLAVTMVAVALLLPDLRWAQNAREGLAATFYVENVVLSADAVDYLREGGPASAVQHYWSLSVEEQLYVVWPVLLFAAALVAARLRRRPRVAATIVVALATGLSFWVSLSLMADSPGAAYFSTAGRAWEFGAGGLLAAAALRSRSPRPPAGPVHVVGAGLAAAGGLAAIVGAGIAYSADTPFPGWTALLPVAGAVAVIGASASPGRLAPGRLLGTRPFQFVGTISYSLYLWHWPVVVVVTSLVGHDLGLRTGVGVIAISLGLAWATKRFVEDRFRAAPRDASLGRTYVPALVGMLVVAMVAGGVNLLTERDSEQARAALSATVTAPGSCFGAASLADGADCPTTTTGPVVPAPIIAQQNRTRLYDDGCWEDPPFPGTTSCSYGDPASPISIALVGNSHAGQWFAAVEAIAAERGAHVTTFVATGCTLTTERLSWETPAQADGCRDWGRRVLAETSSDRYDLIITSEIATRLVEGGSLAKRQQEWQDSYAGVLRAWEAKGKHVLVIRDSPRLPTALGRGPECVAENPTRLSACRGARARWLQPDPLVDAARALGSDRVTVADLTSRFCTSQCSAVVGGVLLFYDGHHLTDTYVTTLVPYLRPPLLEALDGAVQARAGQGATSTR
ncbi:MAG: acyltransferase family protein [Terracoccus sp.]